MSLGTASSRSSDPNANKIDNGGVNDVRRAFRHFASALILAVRHAEIIAESAASTTSTNASSGKSFRGQIDAGGKPAKDTCVDGEGGDGATSVDAANAKKIADEERDKKNAERLDDDLAFILKQRQSIRRNATLLEDKLRGNVKESEALQCCLRSTPCVGGRKRKFSLLNTHDDSKESESIRPWL